MYLSRIQTTRRIGPRHHNPNSNPNHTSTSTIARTTKTKRISKKQRTRQKPSRCQPNRKRNQTTRRTTQPKTTRISRPLGLQRLQKNNGDRINNLHSPTKNSLPNRQMVHPHQHHRLTPSHTFKPLTNPPNIQLNKKLTILALYAIMLKNVGGNESSFGVP